MEYFDQGSKLLQILFVDLLLAGDNAIVIGLVASRFTPEYRRKVIFYGVGVAVLLRVIFALITVQLLAITGLTLAGGLLLLYVCWKLWQELRHSNDNSETTGTGIAQSGTTVSEVRTNPPLLSAIFHIIIADLSMSLDNVIAVAGIAEGHSGLLVIGLAISVLFMMFFANWIANILQKYQWIGYLGLAIIFYVALKLIYDGSTELAPLATSLVS